MAKEDLLMGSCAWVVLLAALGLLSGGSTGDVNSLIQKVLDLLKTSVGS